MQNGFRQLPAPGARPRQRARYARRFSAELWDPYAATPVSRPQRLAGTTAAIHLSGANVAPGSDGHPSYKREILESRVKPTHALAVVLAGLRPKPAVLVCASAIGIYGSRGMRC
jgi:NAD dependent epimerase/dehydratase family enzyme